jgi:hypothetical protein
MESVTDRGNLSSADRSVTGGDRESRGLATPILVSGTLVFIFVTIAILIYDDIRQDNELARELYGTEAELEQMQLPFVSPQSYPSVVDHEFPALSSQETFSPPPQIAVPSPRTAVASNAKINRAVDSDR